MLKATILLLITMGFSFSLLAKDVNWLSYKEARALNDDKPIFVYAKMRFCSACAKMEADELTDKSLVNLLNEHFLPVKETINFAFSSFTFDDLKDKEGNELSFKGFPSIMLVQGEHYSISQGYKNSDELLALLNKVISTQK